mmetsp:Transcript_17842/g.35768  ORF Transcript_17842/g.35768 Transcript_17842/m.35768 type:complete len:939 (+) Transcript_17842:184-3000(+)
MYRKMEQHQAEISNNNEQQNHHQNEDISANVVKFINVHCSCSNECDLIEKVPLDHGIMIMLHDPSTFCMDISKSRKELQIHEKNHPNQENHHQKSTFHPCSCLKIKLQKDANIPQFHPNIYVPKSLLEDPSKLVKYGGGGSGVTVFGGHHPELGSLVMKHGGHKDLMELVSLAKIERELGVRAKWMIDSLGRDDCQRKQCDNESSDCEQGAVLHGVSAHSEGVSSRIHDHGNRNEDGTSLGGSDHSAPKLSERVRGFGINKFAELKKIASNPLLVTVNSMKNIVQSTRVKRSSTGTGLNSMTKIRENRDMTKEEQNEKSGHTAMDDFLQQQGAAQNAVEDMKRRIPAFRMIYISPMHLRERADELKNSTFHSSILSVGLGQESGVISTPPWLEDSFFKECVDRKQQESIRETNKAHLSITSNGSIDSSHSRVEQRKGRIIYLFGAQHVKSSSLTVHRKNVHLCFGGKVKLLNDTGGVSNDELASNSKNPCSMCHSVSDVNGFDGYASLLAFVHQLHGLQRIHNWKITLAQQTIGQSVSPAGSHDDEGNDSRIKPCTTASSLLVRGKLEGQLLHHLIDEEIRVIKNLQLLTMPEELDVLEEVRREFDDLKSRLSSDDRDGNNNVTAADVSPLANMFVGKAIHKNFHPINGRFVVLWDFGKDLASKKIHLKPKEVVPAKHLENLFCKRFGYRNSDGERIPKNSLESTFVLNDEEHSKFSNNDDPHPIFDTGLDQWKSLLELALSMDHPSATNRIWTCGLNDGGLHNLFLNEENLWMFDLGEPSLEPIPAFLTKFLMSFFHALGMEEDEKGDWVVRFEQDENGKLRLTEKTKELLPKVISSFNITVDRLINELFDGYEKVRVLLVRYVVTQLISDSAFCIEKWRTKGGGDESRSDHQYYLEKWLWRALWDIYASEELRRRYLTRMMFKRQLENRHLDSFLG